MVRIGIDAEYLQVFRGQGCSKCHYTGYKGRCGIFELLVMTKEMKSLILTTADANRIKKEAVEKFGMKTLRADGVDKVLKGVTTIEEVYRVCQE